MAVGCKANGVLYSARGNGRADAETVRMTRWPLPILMAAETAADLALDFTFDETSSTVNRGSQDVPVIFAGEG